MNRFLKRHFNRFIPTAARDSIKRRVSRKFVSHATANLSVEERSNALECTFRRDGIARSFLVPLDCRSAVANLVATDEARVEFDSVVRAAETGGCLFDIGAHSGLISAVFCAARTENTVVSFEPSPVLVERLSAIHDLNRFGQRMLIERIGIADENKTLQMLLDPAGGFVQVQRFDHTMWASPQIIDVPMETIEAAASRLQVVPQFIKMDIESYEFEAIKGSLEFLKQHKPIIFLELHLNYLEQRNLSIKQVIEMLQSCGYNFYNSAGSPLKPRQMFDSLLPNIHLVVR